MAADEWRYYATTNRREADDNNRGSAWAQWGGTGRNSASPPHRRDRVDDDGLRLRPSGARPPPQKRRRRHGESGDLPNPKPVHFVSAATVSSSSDEHGEDSRNHPALPSSSTSADPRPPRQSSQACTSPPEPEPGSLASNAVVAQMMRRMNYRQGTGLGRHGQGIVAPIEVALRPKNAGLGSLERSTTVIGGKDGHEPPPPPSDENWPKWDDEAAAAGGGGAWKKRKRDRDVHDDKILARRLEERAAEAVARVQKALARSARWSSSGLRHGDHEEEMVVAAIAKAMKRVQEQRASGTLTTGEVIREFAALKEKCPEGWYTTYRLADTARAVVLPLLHAEFRQWDPLEDPSRGLLLETVTALRGILSDDDDDDDGSSADSSSSPYAALVDDVVVGPALSSAWEAKDPEQPMVRFLDTWGDALPVPAIQRVLERAVMPKLTAAVARWEPRWDPPEPPCHAWVLPWAPLLGRRMLEPVYVAVRRKLGEALQGWRASAADYAMVAPWKDAFGPEAWEAFVGRHVVPYLRRALRALRVATPPAKQDDGGGFQGVVRWAPAVVSVQEMARMLEEEFFGRWQEALCRWLWAEKPTAGEAVAWHERWRRLLTPELVAEERVRERMEAGLHKINRSAEAHYSCSSRSRRRVLVGGGASNKRRW